MRIGSYQIEENLIRILSLKKNSGSGFQVLNCNIQNDNFWPVVGVAEFRFKYFYCVISGYIEETDSDQDPIPKEKNRIPNETGFDTLSLALIHVKLSGTLFIDF